METITIIPPFQTAFNITTNCSDLIDFFKLKYGNYISTFPAQEAETITAIKKGNIYSIAFLGETISDANAALAIDKIMFEHTRYDEKIYALHGGAVEWEGKASMLLAPTTSGKVHSQAILPAEGLDIFQMIAFCWIGQALRFIPIPPQFILGAVALES